MLEVCIKPEREQKLLGFKEPHVSTYCYTVFPRGLPKVQEPNVGLEFLHIKRMDLELQP